MGFFNKLSEYVNTKGKDLDKSIKTFTAANKLQSNISEKEDQIADALKTIGQKYYEAHKDETGAEYAEYVSIISAAKVEIEKIKKELEALKGIQHCPNCGEEVSVEAAFCPKCGTRMPECKPAAEEVKAPAETAVDAVAAEAASIEEIAEKADAAVEAVEAAIEEAKTED